MTKMLFLGILVVVCLSVYSDCGILYPRSSVIREIVSLDGLWQFNLPSNGSTFDINENFGATDVAWSINKAPSRDSLSYNVSGVPVFFSTVDDEDLELMPVPSSYNDVSTNEKVRDHVGVARYHRRFLVPKPWQTKKVWLRFSSVCYSAEVYINGNFTISHQIGHLPFVAEVTELLTYDDYNDITVLVDNTLTNATVPQGGVETLESGRIKETYTFDFFNYAGIDRPVVLYTTEQTYIDDISISTTVDKTSAAVNYYVSVEGNDIFTYQIAVIDKEGNEIASNNQSLVGKLQIRNPNLWWPYLMSDQPGYLYTLKVDLFDSEDILLDRYEQPFGIRELAWDNTTFKINGKPLYLRGFGRHEDSDIRGKGLDLPLIIRDHNLIKWIGANAYRTSHYPYAEEIMDLADRLGIMIIDESPAVNTENFNPGLLENHKKSLTQLVARDKNRPSVIIWSAANEPRTKANESEDYYREVIAHLKSLDLSRPVTVVNNVEPNDDHSGQFLDILSFNKYYAWYDNTGDVDLIVPKFKEYAEAWHNKHNKPVLLTEYGADTLEGLHFVPTYIWSEEFQTDLMSRHFQAFDELRKQSWFIGEMIWNFADFKTAQTYIRVGGNKKGIFTRQRQPKASAHLLRRRYWSLAHELNNANLPSDLDNYIIQKSNDRDEL